MTTKYHHVPPHIDHTADDYDDEWAGVVFLGKSAAGWRFLFHPHDGLYTNATELAGFLETTPGVIVDEYGRVQDPIEWFRWATSKAIPNLSDGRPPHIGRNRTGVECPACGPVRRLQVHGPAWPRVDAERYVEPDGTVWAEGAWS